MSGRTLFVTATDTDAGKTVVSCALLRALRATGQRACGFKPVASGAQATPDGLRSDDALALMTASGSTAGYDDINPVCFAPAIAPHWAARLAGQGIDLDCIAAAHRRLADQHDWVVAEGAGGWLTPLNDAIGLGDWVAAQGWPVLLVVRLRLGCINHALLTAEAIRQRQVPLLGWVANVVPGDGGLDGGNLETLSARLGAPLWQQQEPAYTPESTLPWLNRVVSADRV